MKALAEKLDIELAQIEDVQFEGDSISSIKLDGVQYNVYELGNIIMLQTPDESISRKFQNKVEIYTRTVSNGKTTTVERNEKGKQSNEQTKKISGSTDCFIINIHSRFVQLKKRELL